MRFIDIKTYGGLIKGKITFYDDALHVTRQRFYWYLRHLDDPRKYKGIAEKCTASLQKTNPMTLMVGADVLGAEAEIPR